MNLPLVFEPSACGREVVRLGSVMIGEVAPNPAGRSVQAWARIYLPDITTRPYPATSIEKARQIITDKAREWVEAAGLRV